jgi:16S rRNA (cytidine1402-2'-O)-methyltransferase
MAILYLIPNFLADTVFDDTFPSANRSVILSLDYFIAEDAKPVHKLLKAAGKPTPFAGIEISIFNEHSKSDDIEELTAPLKQGRNAGLVSDAGYPSVADPGEWIVSWAHANGITVIPLIGPSSILLALAASGLHAEQFTFHGYLPAKVAERQKKIREIETVMHRTSYSQLFIETPYRNNDLMNDLCRFCHDHSMLSVSSNLTSSSAVTKTLSIGGWKKQVPDLKGIPSVFILGVC